MTEGFHFRNLCAALEQDKIPLDMMRTFLNESQISTNERRLALAILDTIERQMTRPLARRLKGKETSTISDAYKTVTHKTQAWEDEGEGAGISHDL